MKITVSIKGGYQTFTNNLMFIKHVSVTLAHIPAQYTASFTPTVTEAELPMLSPGPEIPPRYMKIKTYTPPHHHVL